MINKRKLTSSEIDDILSVISPPKTLPEEVRQGIKNKIDSDLYKQLEKIVIYPTKINNLKEEIERQYYKTITPPGESVGVLTAQSIGERQTQMTLNTFHSAGLAIKTVVTGVPRFSELLNATKNPRAVSCEILFRKGNDTISNLRKNIGHSLREFRFNNLIQDLSILKNKEPEEWYCNYIKIYNKDISEFTYCLSVKINKELICRYSIPLYLIVEKIENEYDDIKCISSPEKYAQIDIYIDTSEIQLPDDSYSFITEENKETIYIENIVIPNLKQLLICGVPGIKDFFYKKNVNNQKEEWMVDTEGSNLLELLSHPLIVNEEVMCNNMWEIYTVLGIEAAREFLIDEFMSVVSSDGTFINERHVSLLVDIMTFAGTIHSISRYGMKKANVGVLSKASFEESLDNFLKCAMQGETETTNGVSASIMCGKRANLGSGISKIIPDISQFLNVKVNDMSDIEQKIKDRELEEEMKLEEIETKNNFQHEHIDENNLIEISDENEVDEISNELNFLEF